MVSRTKGTKSRSTPVFHETWLPEQKEYIPEFIGGWKDIFAGKMDSPMAKMLQQNVGEAAMRETGEQTKKLGGMKGISAPAKAKMIEELGGKGVSAMAKVPGDVWAAAKDILSQYALTPPTVASGTASRTSGGGGWGCLSCYILREANDGELEEPLRNFRDRHFPPGGTVDCGYKWMSKWLIPLMKRFNLIKQIVKLVILKPLTKVSNWVDGGDINGYLYIPFSYFWIGVWSALGSILPYQFKEETPRLRLTFYPSMTSTFISRLRSTQSNQKVVI